MPEPKDHELAAAPLIGQPKPPPKKWPVLRHPTLHPFSLAVADGQIRTILTRLDKDPRPLHPEERARMTAELGFLFAALMSYAEAMHNDLKAFAEAQTEAETATKN